jgi:hypothetical protein
MPATQTVKDDTKYTDTRQLLDELDALMDRMLALPIEDHEEPAAPTAAPAATPIVSATLTLLDSPDQVAAPKPLPTAQAEPIRYEVDEPTHATAASAVPTADESVPVPMMTVVGAPARFDFTPLPPVAAGARLRPAHLSYQFLLWINQGYDRGTNWFGKPGRALRSRLGRALLGIAGFALLALALAWLGRDWLGWNWQPHVVK